MDPSSVPFTPQSDIWQLSNTLRNVQEIQQDHAERLLRLERRNDEESRVKSVWAPNSPFPSVLSGTPSQGPTRHHSTLDFPAFDDDQSSNMMRSLQLDPEEEPRRLGATSRANSVRFDDSANQAQFAHNPRSSIELTSRTSSLQGLGGIPMLERSSSHKSEGKQSSAGLSAISGRANSLGVDSHPLLGSSAPSQPPGLAPGLFILGSVPSIIRCWLNTNFKSEAVLYAAICTGSYKSFIDIRLVEDLELSGQVGQDINGISKIKLPVYLPEAVPQSSSSRHGASPQLPSFTVDFTVVDQGQPPSAKSIQCMIGSDALRTHNADILMSTNSMSVFDDERSKWSVPLVRPESDAAFKSLSTTTNPPADLKSRSDYRGSRSASAQRSSRIGDLNGSLPRRSLDGDATASSSLSASADAPVSELATAAESTKTVAEETKPLRASDHDRKPSLSLNLSSSRSESKEAAESAGGRSATSPAIWNNWRRDGSTSASAAPANDWANVSRSASSATYNRPTRDSGIKVLKPTRQISRSSIGNAPIGSPTIGSGSSRFFDDSKRRTEGGPAGSDSGESTVPSRKPSGEAASRKENVGFAGALGKSASQSQSSQRPGANPIGGASAFGWLNSSTGK